MSDFPLVPRWEPQVVVDANDPNRAEIEMPAQREKGNDRPHLVLDLDPDPANWQSAHCSILEFGQPIRSTRDMRNLGRALLAGAAWLDIQQLKRVANAAAPYPKEELQRAARPWSQPDADPLKTLNDFAERAKGLIGGDPPTMVDVLKAGMDLPIRMVTEEDFRREFGRGIKAGPLYPMHTEWLDKRYQEGTL